MTFVIGRGRYARATYPGRGSASSSPSAIAPLSRQWFIDGETEETGQTGSVSQPFATIGAFMTARGNQSVDDAGANLAGWVMPVIGGYTANVSFPAYASTELRADSISTGAVTINGNATWANIAGAHTPTLATIALHNISVSGSFTVTDDANAPTSSVIFGGDELSNTSVTLGGGFVSSTTTKLSGIAFYNAVVIGGINAGSAASSASVIAGNSTIVGDVVAGSIGALNSSFNSSAITLSATGVASFFNCKFTGSAPVLTCLAGARFDGASWISFLEAGGTRAAGTVVLVEGGYSAGIVLGAALAATGNTNVSLDGTGATAGYTGSDSGNAYRSSGATGDATVTLLTGGGEQDGDTILITKSDLAAHTLGVRNNATTTIATIPSGSRGFVLARYSAADGDWVMDQCGALAA